MNLLNFLAKKHFFLFFILIIFLLIEGYINHYHYLFSDIIPTSSFYNDTEKYSKSNEMMKLITAFIWNENGIVETLQIVLLLTSLIFFFIFTKKNIKLHFKFSKNLYVLYFFCLAYYLFEEISWGQHFFKWDTTGILFESNKQMETNFHNNYEIFNQLPRNLLLIWCTLSFLIIKINYFNNHITLKQFIYPSIELKKISILLIIFTFPSIFLEKYLDLATISEDTFNETFFKWKGEQIIENNFGKLKILILDFMNFKFIRLSELQELLFNYYIVTHSYNLKKI